MTIEKNIPIPETSVGRPSKYPFKEMEVGDSFWTNELTSRVMASANRLKPNMFRSKKETKDGNKGIRVWRIK
jgi:hypothetical protein